MNTLLTIEQLAIALSIPSFEQELAISDLPHVMISNTSRVARFVTCRTCGARIMLGPEELFSCPNAPHDVEDECFAINSFDESYNEPNLYQFEQ